MQESITNRNSSFSEIKENLQNKRKRIFNIIDKHNGITAQELSKHYQIPINQVTGRVTELKDLCFIKEAGSLINYFTKKKNTRYVSIKTEDEFKELSREKYVELRGKKDSLVNDYNQALSTYTREYVQNEIRKIEHKIDKLGSAEIAVSF